MGYSAPLNDMRFVIEKVAGLAEINALPPFADATPELVEAALDEANKLARDVLAPLNHSGDREGARLENGVVFTPQGFKEAYAKYVEGGWNSVPFHTDYGGQGLPWLVATALQEMWQGANMSFGLALLLTQGAIDAIHHHGSDEQKRTYLPKMVEGTWTGTMNLTEPQAGSDLALVKTKAVREDGHYRITGQKIFITYGEHDMAENIVHLVLARTPDAPAGVKGISLFIVPKYLPKDDGGPGERNDLRCTGLEEKLGIHGSPTAVMSYGDDGGAIGYLVGEEGRGLNYMFTMMNNARLGVGLQGPAIAEHAYQHAVAYAKDRLQGRDLKTGEGPVPIIRHADVRRMLLTMKAYTEAMRAICYTTAGALDLQGSPDEAAAQRAKALVEVLIPVAKGWCTDIACEVTSIGVQVHGGMGFIEETGAAQFYRDARILPIYEGTNGIQAADLVFRKLGALHSEGVEHLLSDMDALWRELEDMDGDDIAAIRDELGDGMKALRLATEWIRSALAEDQQQAAAASSLYQRLMGHVVGNYLLARGAAAAQAALAAGDNPQFHEAKLVTARFFAEQLLPQGTALLTAMRSTAATAMALSEEQF